MKRAFLQNTNSYENKLMRVQSGHLKTSYSRIKTFLYLIIVLVLMTGSLFAQNNKASVSLTAAIYEEEVSGNLDKAVNLYLDILKKYPDDRQVAAKTLYRLGLINEKMGKQKADEYFKRLVNTYPDQTEVVVLAKARLAVLGVSTGYRQAESVLSERQIWIVPVGYSFSGSCQGYSPDGRYITYSNNENEDMWQHDLTTGEDRKLIDASDSYFGYSAISPDSKQIAYSLYNNMLELRVSGIDGSHMRVLLNHKKKHIYPEAWSPDGKLILAYLWVGGADTQIVLISVEDGSFRVLKSGLRIHPYSFSPDGKYILYSHRKDLNSQATAIFSMSCDGTRDAPLVEGPAKNGKAVWTPDGRNVLFVSDRSGTDGLWSIRVANGKPVGMPELVKPNVGSMYPLGFTSDGSFYYGSSTTQSDIYMADLDPMTGKISSKPERVNENFIGSSKGPLAWSPDGKFLAYNRSGIGTPPSIVVRTISTGEERVIPAKCSSTFAGSRELKWFPDGRTLLVNDAQNNHTTFRQIDLKSGEGKPVIAEGTDKLWVHWQTALSHDGKTLFYSQVGMAGTGAGPLRIIRREIESGEERELYRRNSGGSGLFSLSISPDDKQVAFVTFGSEEGGKNATPLMVVPAEGGSARELCPKVNTIGGAAWTMDGQHILVPGSDSEHPQQLLSVPINGGQPQPTSVSMAELSSPSIHPDGNHIVFAGGQSHESIWAIKNLLAKPKISQEKR